MGDEDREFLANDARLVRNGRRGVIVLHKFIHNDAFANRNAATEDLYKTRI